MKPLVAIVAICAAGYALDHWQQLSHRNPAPVEIPHGLTIYGTKSSEPCVQLQHELDKRGIPYNRKDVADQANFHDLTERFARVGKMGGSFAIPVAEIDGVLYENATIYQVTKKLH
jgi:hypothetical protein